MSHGQRGQSPVHQARGEAWADEAGDPELLSILVSSPAPGLDRGPETEDI